MQVLVAAIDEEAEILQPLWRERDAGLFDQFAQRGDVRRLPLFAMPFRNVPVRGFGGVREQHTAIGVEQHDAAGDHPRAHERARSCNGTLANAAMPAASGDAFITSSATATRRYLAGKTPGADSSTAPSRTAQRPSNGRCDRRPSWFCPA